MIKATLQVTLHSYGPQYINTFSGLTEQVTQITLLSLSRLHTSSTCCINIVLFHGLPHQTHPFPVFHTSFYQYMQVTSASPFYFPTKHSATMFSASTIQNRMLTPQSHASFGLNHTPVSAINGKIDSPKMIMVNGIKYLKIDENAHAHCSNDHEPTESSSSSRVLGKRDQQSLCIWHIDFF